MKKTMEKHLTLREIILENIRDAIVSGRLKAGSKVSEPELAERYGISRTPIREAFRQLESEGYLTVIPRRGAIVSEFSPKDIEEFYAIKSIMEGHSPWSSQGRFHAAIPHYQSNVKPHLLRA